MKKTVAVLVCYFLASFTFGGNVEKVYTFSKVTIHPNGQYQSVMLDHTMLAGLAGEPMLPYHQVALMLPPGEKAISITVTGEELTPIPGSFELFPQQAMQPISKGPDGKFLKNEAVYRSAGDYPATPSGQLLNAYLNGYAFALSTFTPVVYNPAAKSVACYKKVTVTITTAPDTSAIRALNNLTSSENALKRVRLFAQNPLMMQQYPVRSASKTNYQVLIITPDQFQNGFLELVSLYNSKGLETQVATIESIDNSITGLDLPDKIRNYIIGEYQASGIGQVILGGDVEHVPFRGFYCFVFSGSGYEDYNIPADIYYSALDGNWNTNGDSRWAEPGEDDLLPELSVGRMSFSTADEQTNMVHKSVSYQTNPVPEEMKKPYLVSEFLYDPPLTWGSDYLELIVDDHDDNGYSTHGIPSATNFISRLYDTTAFFWSAAGLLEEINAGKSFIHHCGHSGSGYLMRLYNWDITNENFAQVDGIAHNYQLMYTHGCICGAFDDEDCIAELCTSIDNFLVAGIFNSRYGWFNQGTTEGPSAHLHREFISALYHPVPDSAIAELGSAHTMSKIKTAPWVGLPGEFEPGAQRWCIYDCNVLGDPALKVWTDNPSVGSAGPTEKFSGTLTPNPCSNHVSLTFTLAATSPVSISFLNSLGKVVLYRPGAIMCPGSHIVPFQLEAFTPGLYYCRLESNEGISVIKLVVI
jgi:hypothetical protein